MRLCAALELREPRACTSHRMTWPSSAADAAYGSTSQKPTDSTDAVCALSVPRTCRWRAVSLAPGHAARHTHAHLSSGQAGEPRGCVLRTRDDAGACRVDVQACHRPLVERVPLPCCSSETRAQCSRDATCEARRSAPGCEPRTRRSAGSTAAGCIPCDSACACMPTWHAARSAAPAVCGCGAHRSAVRRERAASDWPTVARKHLSAGAA